MRRHGNYSLLLVLLLLISSTAISQTFFVNTGYPGLRDNNTYKLNITPCDTFNGKDTIPMMRYTCLPNQNLNPNYKTMYDDIAIDIDSNIWLVTSIGDLYKRKLHDTSSCQYIGNFTPNHRPVSALVADSAGDLYAVCNWYDSTALLKYDASGFHSLGFLPKNVYSNGDLFFYERRLFLLSYYQTASNSFLTEIIIKDPSQSCYYMGLDSLMTFGGFTIMDNNKSRVFVTAVDKVNYLTSYLVEIDIPNKKVLNKTCTYPLFIRGAASYYEMSGDSTKCPYIAKAINNVEKTQQLIVLNPSTDNIRINTTLRSSEINSIALYDFSGRKIKNYSPENFPNNLDVSNIPDGFYILKIIHGNGKTFSTKVQK